MYFKRKLKGVKHTKLLEGINWIPKRQEKNVTHTPLINNVNWIEFPCRPYAEQLNGGGSPYKLHQSQKVYDFSVLKNDKLKID